MNIQWTKLHPSAVAPRRAHASDAGYDLVATSVELNKKEEYWEYGTGIAVAIPDGHVGLLFPRSSISKTDLQLANSVGVIDPGYRGEVKLRFRDVSYERGSESFACARYDVGDKIGQLIIVPIPGVRWDEVGAEEFAQDSSERGTGGFGSTGS